MNLLPCFKEEFAQPDYWDSFFKKRGGKSFEWYGEYLELCEYLHKYIKNKDNILISGCGNSKLSMDLYDNGFKKITNIDISSVAIKHMISLNKDLRPNMKFLQMDATKMSFPDEEFSVVLDKGTLDALMPDNSQNTLETVKKYFMEIQRVLRNAGRYICITLLQDHILRFLLDYFPSNNFMFRVVRCFDAENSQKNTDQNDSNSSNSNGFSMPVFIVVATKFKILPEPVLEICIDGEKINRITSTDDIIEAVISLQRAVLICNNLNKTSIAGHKEIKIDLYRHGDSIQNPRFAAYIIDIDDLTQKNGRYAAFIVPLGRETEWLFSTPEGRKKLAESAKYNRLAIVILNRYQDYTTLDDVKAELSECIRNLAPKGLKEQIPYLSIGSDIGERNTVACGNTGNSGFWTVEDVKIDDEWYRRLIFEKNKNVVQSEVRYKIVGKNNKKIHDVGYLSCRHHRYMTIGTQLAISKNPSQSPEILVIGLGGGALCTFMNAVFKNSKITAVDIDDEMVFLANEFFWFKEYKRLKVIIEDGITFLESRASKDYHFDAILFDVDSKDLSTGMSCPPKEFLEDETLNNVKKLINTNGIFILNLVCRDEKLRNDVIEKLKQKFKSVCCCKLEEDLNEIIFCQNDDNEYKNLEDWQSGLKKSCKKLNQLVRQYKLSNCVVNVNTLMENLSI